MSTTNREIKFYLTDESSCNYLSNRQQQSIVVDPKLQLTSPLYSLLAANGFRRSGDIAYRPQCVHCQACLSLRIPVSQFKPSRTHLRTMKKNEHLTVRPQPAEFKHEHFDLYCKYLSLRHPGSSMCHPSVDEYKNFLISLDVDTIFYEFRQQEELVAVAVTDLLDHGLSAVCTFYDPNHLEKSLGTYAILWQCQQTKNMNLPWLYLGYWVKECEKMAYKSKFKPAEVFQNDTWQPI